VNSEPIRIVLPSRGHQAGGADIPHGIKALPGVVVVLMDPPEEEISGILLPDSADQDRPDSGIILAAPESYGLTAGDHVGVLPFAGIWFRDAVFNGYRFWEIRYYGIADLCEYDSIRQEPTDLIPVSLHEGQTIQECIKPHADWVLLRRDPVNDQESGILLPDKAQYRSCKATVYGVGPNTRDVLLWDRVVYHGPAISIDFQNLLKFVPELEGDPKDYCLVKESGIYCVIDQ